MTLSTHFGVYGVFLKDEKLLGINKNAGPYQARFDLPGGSPEENEGLTETLVREVLEETGFSVVNYSNNRIYDAFVTPASESHTVHHIFALYDIELDIKNKNNIPTKVVDGENDSDGAIFVDLTTLNPDNSSPLVLKVLAELKKSENYLAKSVFTDWEIKFRNKK